MKRIIVLLLLLGFAYMACGQLVCGYEPLEAHKYNIIVK